MCYGTPVEDVSPSSNLPHTLSSLLSPQSSVPSQYRARSIHLLLSQVNWAGEQVRGATDNTREQQVDIDGAGGQRREAVAHTQSKPFGSLVGTA